MLVEGVDVEEDDQRNEAEEELRQAITRLEEKMREAARSFEFERAAQLRDRVRALKQKDLGGYFAAAVLPRRAISELIGDAAETGESAAGATRPKAERRGLRTRARRPSSRKPPR